MQVDAADRLADDDYNQATRAAKSGVFYPARALNRVTEGRHNRQNSLQRSIERLHARLGEGLPNT